MTTLNEDMAKSMAEANLAWNNFQAAHTVFIANVQRNDFVAAEAERSMMHAALDVYLDAHMAAHRRLKEARSGR